MSVLAGERVLVTTLTKRMAEELSKYFSKLNIKCNTYNEVETMERVEILRDLRLGDLMFSWVICCVRVLIFGSFSGAILDAIKRIPSK